VHANALSELFDTPLTPSLSVEVTPLRIRKQKFETRELAARD